MPAASPALARRSVGRALPLRFRGSAASDDAFLAVPVDAERSNLQCVQAEDKRTRYVPWDTGISGSNTSSGMTTSQVSHLSPSG